MPHTESPIKFAEMPTGSYDRLATVFRQDGFTFQELKRSGMKALYSKSKLGYQGYEVVVIRNQEEYTIAGKTVSAREVYPNNEGWGTIGWTYLSYQHALEKFNRLKK